jgi:hypothetical protein
VLYGVAAWAVGLPESLAAGVRDIGRIYFWMAALDVHLGGRAIPLPS